MLDYWGDKHMNCPRGERRYEGSKILGTINARNTRERILYVLKSTNMTVCANFEVMHQMFRF
jgi:hypothetical protein